MSMTASRSRIAITACLGRRLRAHSDVAPRASRTPSDRSQRPRATRPQPRRAIAHRLGRGEGYSPGPSHAQPCNRLGPGCTVVRVHDGTDPPPPYLLARLYMVGCSGRPRTASPSRQSTPKLCRASRRPGCRRKARKRPRRSSRADLWPSRDVRHYGCRRPTDRPWYPPVHAYPHPPDARAGMRVGAG